MAEDRILHCQECGASFLWAAEEQAHSPTPPGLCPMCRRLAPPAGHRRGAVKWFSRSKGYGFITVTDGTEIFVHKSGLAAGQAPLRAGQLVQFTVSVGTRGIQAQDVIVLEVAEP